eukprot:1400507-Amphidinium_carterae.1
MSEGGSDRSHAGVLPVVVVVAVVVIAVVLWVVSKCLSLWMPLWRQPCASQAPAVESLSALYTGTLVCELVERNGQEITVGKSLVLQKGCVVEAHFGLFRALILELDDVGEEVVAGCDSHS